MTLNGLTPPSLLRPALCLCLGLGLAACAPMTPPASSVAPPVPAVYPDQAATTAATTAALPAWQDFYADPELRRVIALALDNSRDLRAAVPRVNEAAAAYLGLREIDERLALARRTFASRDESVRIFRRRYELGAASRLNVTQVELLRQQAAAQVAQLEHARAQARALLDLLVGTPVVLAPPAGTLGAVPLARDLEPGLPSELVLERADFAAAERLLAAARANVGAARAAFFPRIALTAAFGTSSASLDTLFDRETRAWRLTPSLALPIFNGGRLKGQRSIAQVRTDLAVAQYERTVQAAFRDVADALAARRWPGDQAEALRVTLALQGERARLARLRYENGSAAYLEVLDAERERFGAEQQLVQLRRQQLSAQVALYRALGGGARQLPGAMAQQDRTYRNPQQ